MQYGRFDDANKEYVIERPDTPRSWTNYLGSTEYGAIITQNAGGYSFIRSAAAGRFTRLRFNAVPADQPGRYFYVRDDDTGDYWSVSWQPVGKPLDAYRSVCRHGTGYTVIQSEYAGIRAVTTYFVPLGHEFEYWLLELHNASSEARRLSLFTYVEYASEWKSTADLIDIQYSLATVRCDVVDGMIDQMICNDLPLIAVGRERQRLHTFLAATGADIEGWETDREAFLGPYRTYANPLAVERGRCSGSLAWGDNACGVLHMRVNLAAGGTRAVVVTLGMGCADTAGRAVRAEYGSLSRAQTELARVKDHWHRRLETLVVETPDPEWNSMINVWNPYNCLVAYAWSRSASLVYSGERDGLGYRDTVQDILGVLPAIAEEARERLELMLTGQFSTGGAMPVVKPFEHKPGTAPLPAPDAYRSDDCLWFFFTVPEYVKESGNLDFYGKVLPYADAGEGTVLQHLKQALLFNLERTGAHGLPAALEADWNDCLGLGRQGESVMVAFQLRHALATYDDICTRLNAPAEAAWARDRLQVLDRAIQDHCWDGRWFLRAFRDGRTAIGASRNAQGRIFLNAQTWAVLSGAARLEQGRSAMESVHRMLATEYGLMLCAPAFTTPDETAAANILDNPGIKENAGIFCHTQGWAVMAESLLGNPERAYAYFRAYLPAAFNARAELRQVEPYVYCQSTHSRFSRKFGVSRTPWLSGTASWSYYAATHYLLGIRPEYDGLTVDPCLPAAWREVSATRCFRGKRFRITIRNGSAGTGVERLELNGRPLQGSLLPADQARDDNDVQVQLA